MTTAHDGSAERLGIIGDRQLIAVQTMDIARLTAHPVALIPGIFIAVTGMGPTDSNESGKTSFLSAVSLLLGDPEWRVGGTGAASVEALLFEPVTAGAVVGVNAATEGFIVGVFAAPENVAATTHTVWMRISATKPHLQVRHAPGLHLARGTSNAERHEQAPEIYRALGGDPIGSADYAHVLYGRSPRVLAYVASRGRVRSRPSLLKLDAGTFTPEQIGDALITLTGRATLFERDQQDRRDLATRQAELDQLIKRDEKQTTQEDEILRHVRMRTGLRSQAAGAASQWTSHLARAALDTCAKAESAAALLADAMPGRKAINTELERYRAELEALRDTEALRKAASNAEQVHVQRKADYDEAMRQDGALERDLNRTEGELRDSRIKAADHDLDRDGTATQCAAARDDLAGQLSVAGQDIENARLEVQQASDDLRNAEQGQFGPAGLVIRALGPNVPAVSLADATRLAPETRHQWEARLAPWRDAVCIPDRPPIPSVLQALRDIPGAIIISRGQSPSRDSNTTVGLPEGVLDAPPEALPLLHALATQQADDHPIPHASDLATGVHIVGGFDVPVIGGEDLRAHLRGLLTQAQKRVIALDQQVRTLEVKAEHAAVTATRADAAERVTFLASQAATLTEQLAEHRGKIATLQKPYEAAWIAHQKAQLAIANRDQDITRLSGLIQTTQARLRAKDLEVERLKTASYPDDAILAAWGRGLDAARAELRWPPAEPAEADLPDRVREEAIPPPTPSGGDDSERRKQATLAEAARTQLGTALSALEYQAEGVGAAPEDLRYGASRFLKARQAGDADPHGRLFESTLADLQAWLDDSADRDSTAPEQVSQARADRANIIQTVSSKTRELQHQLHQTQEAIAQRALSAIDAISDALDSLNRKAGGLGALLGREVLPPSGPDQNWTCQVTPRWRRNPGGPELPYNNVTNTAQEKLFSIHLVLAALLAAPYPRGRVLILDELGDSLGAEHRREVLDAIATVAKQHGITVLATCQDAIMAEARPHCGEILYFHYPSRSAALNRPTRMFGLDPNGGRVELTTEALTEGRGRLPTDPQ